MENGNGSLNISWSHTTTEGEEKFILNATNLNNSNADPILVTGIEDFYKILSIQDSMPCDVYSFQVTATNDAGASGPSDSITSTFPALPNISTVVEHYSLRNMDDGVTLNVTLTVRFSNYFNWPQPLCSIGLGQWVWLIIVSDLGGSFAIRIFRTVKGCPTKHTCALLSM